MIRNRNLQVLATALVLGATIVSTAQAQPPSGGRRGFGTRGRASIVFLLGMEQVQKELNLNEDQLAKANKMSEEARAEFAALRDIEDREERTAKMTELSEKQNQEAREQLRGVLEREQMRRLFQIRMQMTSAVENLSNEYLARRLELTDDQKEKLAKISKDTDAKRSELMAAMRDQDQRAEAFQKFRQAREEADKQALGVLTSEQKDTYEEMKGEKIELEFRRRPR